MSVLGSTMGVNFAKQVKFVFSNCLIKRPLIYEMSQVYDIVTNIESADINDSDGWVIMRISGTGDAMDKALQWMADQGVSVQMMFPNLSKVPKVAPPAVVVFPTISGTTTTANTTTISFSLSYEENK